MKYSVIGQSNTLVRGNFVDQLREKFPHHEVGSLGRVGASSSVILPLFASDPSFFSGSKFCIIDVCVIDAGMVAGGQLNIDIAKNILSWLGHISRKNGCEPIFLIIPTEHHIKSPEFRAPYFEMIKSVIADGNYLYIDAGQIISQTAKNTGLSASNGCFDDPRHLNEETFSDIASMLSWFFEIPAPTKSRRVRVRARIPNFHRVRASEQKGAFQSRNHRSSAVAFNGVFIPLWSKFDLDIGGGTIFAAMLNVTTSHCLARLKGVDTALVNFEITPYSNRPFEARVVHIPTPVEAKDGKIEIMPIPITSPTRMSPPQNPGLEIGDVVVLDGEMDVAYDYRPIGGDTNIFSRFISSGMALSCRSSTKVHKIFANSVTDFAMRSGVQAHYTGDDQFGVCQISPSINQIVELPTPSGMFTGKITAAKANDGECSAIELRSAAGETRVIGLSNELRASSFEGEGDTLSISSIPPGTKFVVEKVIMTPKPKRRIRLVSM